MSKRSRRILLAGLVIAGTAAAVALAVALRQRQHVADEASEAILTRLDDMDPVTRVMVERRLATHVAHDIESKVHRLKGAAHPGD